MSHARKSARHFYAERVGFEPTKGLLPYCISSAAPSATQPPLLKQSLCDCSDDPPKVDVVLCPREESNFDPRVRSALFYPLNYEGLFCFFTVARFKIFGTVYPFT